MWLQSCECSLPLRQRADSVISDIDVEIFAWNWKAKHEQWKQEPNTHDCIVSFYSMCPMPFCFCLCDQTHPLWINIHTVFQQARGMEKSWIRSNMLYCTCWILLFLPWVSWDTQLSKQISAGVCVCVCERVSVCVCIYAILIKCKQRKNK